MNNIKNIQNSSTDSVNKDLLTEDISKLLLKYSVPAVISFAIVSIYNIVDRVFIGQGVGAMAISGLSLTLPLMTIVTAIGTLIGAGASARISIVLGKRDIPWARAILGNSLVLTTSLSIVFITISMIFLDEILVAFGGSDNTIPYAKEYLNIVIPGSILTNVGYNHTAMMRSSGHPKKSMYYILAGAFSNIILDALFIFGFGMGIKGAAIATVLSMMLTTILALNHFIDKKNIVHFSKECFKLQKRIVKNIISIGLSPFLMHLVASMVAIIMNTKLITYGGDLAIGAYGIINSYAMLAVMFIQGLSQGMQPIIGYNFGADKFKRVKDTLKKAIKYGVIIASVSFALAMLIPKFIVMAFTVDPELVKLSSQGLRLVLLMFPIVGFQIVVSVFFQSIGSAEKSIFLTLTRQVIFLIPFIYLFSGLWGLSGIWLSCPASDFFAATLSAVLLRQYIRKKYNRNIVREKNRDLHPL